MAPITAPIPWSSPTKLDTQWLKQVFGWWQSEKSWNFSWFLSPGGARFLEQLALLHFLHLHVICLGDPQCMRIPSNFQVGYSSSNTQCAGEHVSPLCDIDFSGFWALAGSVIAGMTLRYTMPCWDHCPHCFWCWFGYCWWVLFPGSLTFEMAVRLISTYMLLNVPLFMFNWVNSKWIVCHSPLQSIWWGFLFSCLRDSTALQVSLIPFTDALTCWYAH